MTAAVKSPVEMKVFQLENANRALELRNTLTQLVKGFDQSNLTSFNPILENNIYGSLTINYTMLSYMYKTHGLIQAAIDMPVLDALRGGVDIRSSKLDEDEQQDFLDDLEEEGVFDKIGEGMIWTRLFGGGGWIINTGDRPDKPLDPRRIDIIKIIPFARWELRNGQRFAEYYDFYGMKIHQSRVITMAGKAAPFNIRPLLQNWGMSEVERMVQDFNVYIKTKNVLYEFLEHAKQDVLKLDGLNSAVVTDGGTEILQARIQAINQLRSFTSALCLDKEDEYDVKQPSMTGIADVMAENRMAIASALRIPQAKLFGMSASGFSSGEDAIENYNAMVESEIRQPLKKPLRLILDLYQAAKYGVEPDMRFKFHALRVLSAVEEESIKTSKWNRIRDAWDRRMMAPKEVSEACKKDNLFPVELKSIETMEEFPDQEEEQAAAANE